MIIGADVAWSLHCVNAMRSVCRPCDKRGQIYGMPETAPESKPSLCSSMLAIAVATLPRSSSVRFSWINLCRSSLSSAKCSCKTCFSTRSRSRLRLEWITFRRRVQEPNQRPLRFLFHLDRQESFIRRDYGVLSTGHTFRPPTAPVRHLCRPVLAKPKASSFFGEVIFCSHRNIRPITEIDLICGGLRANVQP
jgi:hypothetical protein